MAAEKSGANADTSTTGTLHKVNNMMKHNRERDIVRFVCAKKANYSAPGIVIPA
jgi:hypothetical protein